MDDQKAFYFTLINIVQGVFIIFGGFIRERPTIVRLTMLFLVITNLSLILSNLFVSKFYREQKHIRQMCLYILIMQFLIVWIMGFENIAVHILLVDKMEIYIYFGVAFTIFFRVIKNFSEIGQMRVIEYIMEPENLNQLSILRFIYKTHDHIENSLKGGFGSESNIKKTKEELQSALIVESLILNHKRDCANVYCLCKKEEDALRELKTEDQIKQVANYIMLNVNEKVKLLNAKNKTVFTTLKLAIGFHKLMYMGQLNGLSDFFLNREEYAKKKNLQLSFFDHCIQDYCDNNLYSGTVGLYFYKTKVQTYASKLRESVANSLKHNIGIRNLKSKILKNFDLRISCIKQFIKMPNSQRYYSSSLQFWEINNTIVQDSDRLMALTSNRCPRTCLSMHFYYLYCRQDPKNGINML